MEKQRESNPPALIDLQQEILFFHARYYESVSSRSAIIFSNSGYGDVMDFLLYLYLPDKIV